MRAELTIEIACPPDEAFAFLADVSNLPRWQSGVRTAERHGDRIEESRTMLGRELHTTLLVEEEEPPRLLTLRAASSPVPFSVRHELEPSGGGTVLTVTAEAETSLLPGFASGLMARRAEKQFRKDFEKLKRILES